jgi:predicted transcriptional regulator
MAKQKLRAATIRVEPELWERIERLAQADRRPVANYLALVIADAIAAQSAGSDSRVAEPGADRHSSVSTRGYQHSASK